MTEAASKTPKDGVQCSIHVLGKWHTADSKGTEAPVLGTPHQTSSCGLPHLARIPPRVTGLCSPGRACGMLPGSGRLPCSLHHRSPHVGSSLEFRLRDVHSLPGESQVLLLTPRPVLLSGSSTVYSYLLTMLLVTSLLLVCWPSTSQGQRTCLYHPCCLYYWAWQLPRNICWVNESRAWDSISQSNSVEYDF